MKEKNQILQILEGWANVIKDKFKDYISINGLVKPISTVYLDAYEGGRVLEILIEDYKLGNI